MATKNSPKPVHDTPEIEPTFEELLRERLKIIADNLPDSISVSEWLNEHDGDLDQLKRGADREDVCGCFHYLRGAHEAMNVTMSEMFECENIDLDHLDTEH